VQPDEAVLKRYLLGELDDAEAAWVGRCLESNPALLDTLEALARSDPFIAALRGARPAPPDGPKVEALIDRLKRLAGAAKPADSTPAPDGPSTDSGKARPPAADTPASGERAGFPKLKGYRILRVVGAGGMGMVFEAVDEKLNRRVALKVMKPEVAANPNARARFVREAKAVAAIEHDNVVPIFHIGDEGDCPFLAMPFLKGEPLDRYFGRSAFLPPQEIARIGREAALGLAAVHERGLVHRDIKPGNLWVERFGDGRAWRVKLVDFGLARGAADGEEPITQAGAVVGTPQFMSPEQARGAPVDFRSDLFSLGATLYLLATGRPPFGSSPVMAVLTALAVQAPAPVRELNPGIPESLAELIEQLLAKNPQDRPQSAAEVAEALRDIEVGIKAPLVALPVGAAPAEEWEEVASSERAPKARRRSRGTFLVAAAVLFALAGAGAAAFTAYKLVIETKYGQIIVEVNDPNADVRVKDGALELRDQRGELKYTVRLSERNKELPVGEYRMTVTGTDGLVLETDALRIKKGEATPVHITVKPPAGKGATPAPNPGPNPTPVPIPASQPAVAVPPPSEALLALRPGQIPPEVLAAAGFGGAKEAPAALVGLLGLPRPTHREAVMSVAYSPDGRWLASASTDKTIILHDARTGIAKRTLAGHAGAVFSVAFTKDSKTLVSAATDGAIRLWPVERDTAPEVVEVGIDPTDWLAMALSPDDRWVAVGNGKGAIRLWKFGDWKNPADIPDLEQKVRMRALAFSPDGEDLAAGGLSNEGEATDAFVFRTGTRKLDSTWATEGRAALSLQFSRDGKKLATGGGPGHPRGMARIWDLEAKKVVFDVQQFRDYVHALALDPDARHLVVCNGDEGVNVYDVATQKIVGSMSGWFGNVLRSAAFSPDGQSLALGTHDGGLMVFDALLAKQKYTERGPSHLIWSVAATPDGSSALVTTTENALYRFDLAAPRKPRLVHQYDQAAKFVTYSPDGSKYALAVGSYGFTPDTVHVYEAATDKLLHKSVTAYLLHLSFTPDSKGLMASGLNSTAVLFDAATGAELYRAPPNGFTPLAHAISADGKTAALREVQGKRVAILNVETGNEIRSWELAQGGVARATAYDPRGRYLGLGEADKTVTLWDAQTGKPVRTLAGHSAALTGLQFTPDGSALVSSARDGTLRVWTPEAQRAKAVIPVGPAGQPCCFSLDRSGRFAFVGIPGGAVLVLKVP
jgi:WD40 repeat protein